MSGDDLDGALELPRLHSVSGGQHSYQTTSKILKRKTVCPIGSRKQKRPLIWRTQYE